MTGPESFFDKAKRIASEARATLDSVTETAREIKVGVDEVRDVFKSPDNGSSASEPADSDQQSSADTSKSESSETIPEKPGKKLESVIIGIDKISFYEGGFVKVASRGPHKLLGISLGVNVQKKTGLGRTIGAAVSLGANVLLSSNLRGSATLVIVTDKKTFTINARPPTEGWISRATKAEAIGNALIK